MGPSAETGRMNGQPLMAWWNLIFVLPFGLALLYLALYTLTGVTFGDADTAVDADGELDADADADADAGADRDADADADGESGEGECSDGHAPLHAALGAL